MGALGKGGRFAESLPDLALGKVASPLKRFGAAPQAAQGEPFRPQPRRRRSPPRPAARAAAAAPPEPRRRRSPRQHTHHRSGVFSLPSIGLFSFPAGTRACSPSRRHRISRRENPHVLISATTLHSGKWPGKRPF